MDLRRWALVPVGGVLNHRLWDSIHENQQVFFLGGLFVVLWFGTERLCKELFQPELFQVMIKWDVYNLNIEPYIFSKTCSLRPALQFLNTSNSAARQFPPRKLTWLAGKWTMNESMHFLLNRGIFQVVMLVFMGVIVQTWQKTSGYYPGQCHPL